MRWSQQCSLWYDGAWRRKKNNNMDVRGCKWDREENVKERGRAAREGLSSGFSKRLAKIKPCPKFKKLQALFNYRSLSSPATLDRLNETHNSLPSRPFKFLWQNILWWYFRCVDTERLNKSAGLRERRREGWVDREGKKRWMEALISRKTAV